ncbi:MAG: rhamnulokinase [Ruminococcus sp.]|nr:rhamnulokinase [Ruminococcus sp.]
MKKTVLAIDLGQAWGRGMIAETDGEKITLKEIIRFNNTPVKVKGTLYWDVLRQFKQIKRCIIAARPYKPQSLAIDTWGCDFALLDRNGNLVGNPVHFMDERTAGMVEYLDITEMPLKRLYEITGVQVIGFNTIFQLEALMVNHDILLDIASEMLFMPDYFNYLLCGEDRTDPSIATTSQMIDAKTKLWSREILDAIELDRPHPAGICQSGTVLGPLLPELAKSMEVEPLDIILGCGHDTQCAIAAVPAEENEDILYISSGAWCMFGTELDEAIINEKTAKYNWSNETGFGGKTTLLKTMVGLWLMENCYHVWKNEGKNYTYLDLAEMAFATKPFAAMFDTMWEEFAGADNVPARLRDYFEFTGQDIPEGVGGYIRAIHESLAMKFRTAKEELEEITGKSYKRIYLVGGGCRFKTLAQFTANATGCEVVTGPVESTSYGNAIIQLIAKGDLKDLAEGRRLIRNSVELTVYRPQNVDEWDTAYEQYKIICARGR